MLHYIILAMILLFFAVILIRTALFRPKQQTSAVRIEAEFEKEAAIGALGELVKCKTVSYSDSTLEDDAEFEKMIAMLPALYPNVYLSCALTRLPGRALLYRWKGEGNGDPAVLMAHYDVVPVDESNWTKPPFSAIIEDGIMWGRGTLDTKVTFNGILSAAENLIKQGFVPKNDIYFAFSGGEEVNGPGACHIVDYFVEHSITPSFVLDEGGGVVEHVFPGVKASCAMIGIAEKGMLNLKYMVRSDGGHSSAPGPNTPVVRLAKACAKVEAKPFKAHITEPVRKMFDTLGRHSTFLYRLIFANLWCFGWVIDALGKKSGGEMNALLRTTVAFTQMQGSPAPNVIPTEAYMVSNLRLNPEDSVSAAQEYIRKTIQDESIALSVEACMEPSPISRTDCKGWDVVANAIAGTWEGAIISPYLMVQCSDSRHYRNLSDKVYRFSAMDLTSEERKTIHGNNERIRLEVVGRAVEFFIRVMKQC